MSTSHEALPEMHERYAESFGVDSEAGRRFWRQLSRQ
jgi:hypothetical protein